jgi:hypothetical protein
MQKSKPGVHGRKTTMKINGGFDGKDPDQVME